jgi:membrane protein implicated in regulation of membrane protease activity
MNDVGKVLVVLGLALALLGALLWSGFGKGWFGRLPGDIQYSKGNFHFYFPIVTCLILSVVLTLILRLFRK